MLHHAVARRDHMDHVGRLTTRRPTGRLDQRIDGNADGQPLELFEPPWPLFRPSDARGHVRAAPHLGVVIRRPAEDPAIGQIGQQHDHRGGAEIRGQAEPAAVPGRARPDQLSMAVGRPCRHHRRVRRAKGPGQLAHRGRSGRPRGRAEREHLRRKLEVGGRRGRKLRRRRHADEPHGRVPWKGIENKVLGDAARGIVERRRGNVHFTQRPGGPRAASQ